MSHGEFIDLQARERIDAHDDDLDDLSRRQDEADEGIKRLADLLGRVDRKLDALIQHHAVPFKDPTGG